jgi:hypothetical protein
MIVGGPGGALQRMLRYIHSVILLVFLNCKDLKPLKYHEYTAEIYGSGRYDRV